MKKIIIIITLSVFIFFTLDAQRKLTVDETLDFIKRDYVDSIPEEAINLSKIANPNVRPILYKILNDTNQINIWAKVMGSFAYLGQIDDIYKIENFINNRAKILKAEEYNAIVMAFIVLGELNRREIPNAKAIHLNMLTWNYWAKLKYKFYEQKNEEDKTFIKIILLKALNGYAYSSDSNFNQVANNVYNELFNNFFSEKERVILKTKIDGIKEFYNQIEVLRKAGKWN